MTTEELLKNWRDAERSAFKAEFDLYEMGQLAADPRITSMFAEAGRLRLEADQQFTFLANAMVFNRQGT